MTVYHDVKLMITSFFRCNGLQPNNKQNVLSNLLQACCHQFPSIKFTAVSTSRPGLKLIYWAFFKSIIIAELWQLEGAAKWSHIPIWEKKETH